MRGDDGGDDGIDDGGDCGGDDGGDDGGYLVTRPEVPTCPPPTSGHTGSRPRSQVRSGHSTGCEPKHHIGGRSAYIN